MHDFIYTKNQNEKRIITFNQLISASLTEYRENFFPPHYTALRSAIARSQSKVFVRSLCLCISISNFILIKPFSFPITIRAVFDSISFNVPKSNTYRFVITVFMIFSLFASWPRGIGIFIYLFCYHLCSCFVESKQIPGIRIYLNGFENGKISNSENKAIDIIIGLCHHRYRRLAQILYIVAVLSKYRMYKINNIVAFVCVRVANRICMRYI